MYRAHCTYLRLQELHSHGLKRFHHFFVNLVDENLGKTLNVLATRDNVAYYMP